VLVLSINSINTKPLVVTVVPGGTRSPDKPRYVTEVEVQPSQENGLPQPTIFQCIQIKALDHGRFDTAAVGTIAANDLQRVEQTVKLCLGLP